MSPPVDPAHPLSVFTYRELLANRAMARKRGRGKAHAMVARIDAELERRRAMRGDRLFRSVPSVSALDETAKPARRRYQRSHKPGVTGT